jgi:hypothetical protein
MPFASRINVHGDGFLKRLELEVKQLARKHPAGFTVRLHVLGDFYSVEYVKYWERLIRAYPVSVFGYTHRIDDIGREVERVFTDNPGRFNILQSNGGFGTRPIAMRAGSPGSENLPTCPQQTGKAASCLDCGLCTLPYVKGVKFISH